MKKFTACTLTMSLMCMSSNMVLAQECFVEPLSDRVPDQSVAQATITNNDETAIASFWHEACDTDSNNSRIMLRIQPTTPEFGFGSDFFAIQDGYTYDRISFLTMEDGDRVNVASSTTTFLVEISDRGADRAVIPNKAISFFHEDDDRVTEFELSDYQAPSGGEIVMQLSLEEPVNGGTASGISNIRGWIVASSGVRQLEYFIDGQYAGVLPYGGERRDVEQAFPEVSNSIYSGFGQTYNYGLLDPGSHTMTVRAQSEDGSVREASATFNVITFPDEFIDTPNFPAVDASQIQAGSTGSEFVLRRVTLEDGTSYQITLKWIPATQSFDMVSLERLPD